MKRRRASTIVLMAALAALVPATAACARPGAPEPGGSGSVSTTPAGPGGATTGTRPADPPASDGATTGGEYRVTYGLAVPAGVITIKHTIKPPIAPPPAPPLPYLVGIYVGDHPEGKPAYARISFYFRGAFPGYSFGYVPSVTSDGKGEPIPLQGNAFIRIGFVDAQAHDDSGASTIKVKPAETIGLHNLKSYGFAGDFEGHVTFGLGVQVAPGSDQILPLRTGELKKPDGAGGFFYVVHLDVQNG